MDRYTYNRIKQQFGGAGQALKVAMNFFLKILEQIDDRQITEKWIQKFNEDAGQLLYKQDEIDARRTDKQV